jgi:Homeodomain-like domain
MRTGRPKTPLILSMEERGELESLAHRSRSVPALARRARIVSVGLCHRTGQQDRVTPATVGKWRTRFVQERLARLYDEPRPGVPRRITDDEIEQVVVRTLESTPRGATHWSTRGMAKATGLSHGTISRIAVSPSSCPPIRCSCRKCAISWGCTSTRRSTPWCCVWTRSRRFERWSRCCRCGPASPSGKRTTTNAMTPPRCLPRSTRRVAK